MLTTFGSRTRFARSLVVWVACVRVCSVALGARAQDGFELDAPESPPAADGAHEAAPAAPAQDTRSPLEVSREHMERGQALYGAGRYIESAEEFLRAYEAQPFSAFLYNAGVAYEKVDDPGRAADYFARFLQTDPQADNAAQLSARIERLRGLARAREAEDAAESAVQSTNSATTLAELEAARARLAEVQAQLAALGGKDSFKSLLSVQTQPTDASVLVKAQSGEVLYRGVGPKFTQTLDPGAYVVEVQHPKFTTIAAPITVAPAVVNVVLAEMSQGQFLGFLRVQSDVPGADVFVDEREAGALGRTPFQTPLKAGKHHVWIERPGYKPVERDVDVHVGEDPLLKVTLERVEHGRIRVVASRADALVYVDGKRVGRVPVETDVRAGMHTVTVSADGMKPWQEQVSVQRGQETPLRVRLRPKMGRKGAWVTAGVAAGFLGAAIATGVMGHKLEGELDDDTAARTLQSDDARIQRGKYLYIGSNVGYGLSLGLAALATYYFIRDPLPDSEGRVLAPRDWAFNVEMRPDVSSDRVGGRLHVSF